MRQKAYETLFPSIISLSLILSDEFVISRINEGRGVGGREVVNLFLNSNKKFGRKAGANLMNLSEPFVK